MLIACKCLNVMLGSIASTNNDAEEGKSPTTTTFDSNQVADPNSDIFELLDAPMPVVSRAALERLTIDQINFFKTVSFFRSILRQLEINDSVLFLRNILPVYKKPFRNIR